MHTFCVVLDYDYTITAQVSTIPLIAELPPKTVDWSVFDNAWLKAIQSVIPSYPSSNSITKQSVLQNVLSFLSQFHGIELENINNVSNEKALRGISKASLYKLGREIKVKEGVQEFFDNNINETSNLYINSLNWSRDLIFSTVSRLTDALKFENVFSADLEFDENNEVSTGKVLCDGFASAIDKIPVMQNIRNRHPEANLLYIGDSKSDIPSLIFADLGILIIKPTKGMLEMADRLQFQFCHLAEKNNQNNLQVCIYFVDGWIELNKYF